MGKVKRVGCFVCNYNKRDYVLGCVETLLHQSYNLIDIYVVDNASTDGSAEALREAFWNRITVIVNEENLGGSGGFARGIELALENGYEYAVLLDNDVKVDGNCVENMVNFMDKNSDVGILGAKILQMANPSRIQDMGGSITSEYNMVGNYWGYEDNNMPDVVEGDYISTCTAMLRMEAVKTFGSMPIENFIYWDDVELSKKCQKAGYRTLALGNAKVWHKMQTANDTPFNRYYLTRNRFKLFSIYADEQELERFKEVTFKDVFFRSFMYEYKGKEGIAKTYINALEDFIEGKFGKAQDGRLIEQTPVKTMLEKAITGHNRISVKADLTNPDHRFVVNRIKEFAGNDAIVSTGREFVGSEDYLRIAICEHVKEVKKNMLPVVMTDRFMHCIATVEQYKKINGIDDEFESFRDRYWKPFSDAVDQIRKRGSI